MRRSAWTRSVAMLSLGGLGAGCASTAPPGGPLPVRNQHPAQLTVLHMDPAPATVLPAGHVVVRENLAYSSLWLRGSVGTRRFEMDGETLRAATRLQFGLGADLEFGLELPVAHTSGGFLDAFIIDYHSWFGFPDQGRDTNPRGDYAIGASRNGQSLWSVEADGLAFLDVPLQLTWTAVEPTAQRPGLALRGALELPTGDADRGYGSGGVDASLGMLLQHRTGPLEWYGHAQHTFASTPNATRRAGLTFADVTSLGGAVELPLGDTLAALVQVEWETSTLRELDIPVVSRDQLLLWVGGRLCVADEWNVEIGFGEDLQGLVSPDFTAWLSVAWKPGAGAARTPPPLPR